MSFDIKINSKIATIHFKNEVKENEIKHAFIELTEQFSISKLNAIVLDFIDITSYQIPHNYLEILKMITLFSENWNSTIKVAAIATNSNIRTVVSEIIKRKDEFKWEYRLFDDRKKVDEWLNQH